MMKTLLLMLLLAPIAVMAQPTVYECQPAGAASNTATSGGNAPLSTPLPIVIVATPPATSVGICTIAANVPNTEFTRVSTDGGASYVWATLASVGLGIAPIVAAPSVAAGTNVSITWTPPTVNADGSALSPLTAFTVYRGPTPTSLARLNSVGSTVLAYSDSNMPVGTWYYAVTASNTAGESAQTGPVSITVMAPVTTPSVPGVPGSVKVNLSITIPSP